MNHQLIQLLESEQQAVDFGIKRLRFVPASDLPLLNFFPTGSRILYGCRVSPGNQLMILNSVPFTKLNPYTNLDFVSVRAHVWLAEFQGFPSVFHHRYWCTEAGQFDLICRI